MKKIGLKPVNEENIDACLTLSVGEEQQDFVAPVAKSLAYAYAHRNYAVPFGIYAGAKLVGYVLTIYDPSDKMYCIWHMLIDKHHQGKGYGTAGLQQVIAYFQTGLSEKGTSVGLSCHEENHMAIAVYEKLGFKKTGEKDEDGEVILLRTL